MNIRTATLLLATSLAASATAQSNDALRLSPRIIGGQSTHIDQYPFMAGLVKRGEDRRETFCGASVISSRWIITAAHCVENERASTLDVITGSDNLDSGNATRIQAEKIVMHPRYNSRSVDNDIALIRLSRATDAPAIQVASQSDRAAEETGSAVSVAGWGNTSTSGESYPMQLREVDLQIADFASCSRAYDGLNSTQLCAWMPGGGHDSCQGDSGGPLIARTANGVRLLGIVSFGDECGSATHPGVYTRVSQFGSFLDRTTGNTTVVATAGSGPDSSGANPPQTESDNSVDPSDTGEITDHSEPPHNADAEDGETSFNYADMQSLYPNLSIERILDVEVVEYLPFDAVETGTSGQAEVLFHNDGNTPATLSDFQTQGRNVVDIIDENCTQSPLDPGAECLAILRWTPTVNGRLDARLSARIYTDQDNGQVLLPLFGRAVQTVATGDSAGPVDFFTDQPQSWALDFADTTSGEGAMVNAFGGNDSVDLFGELSHGDESMEMHWLSFDYQGSGVLANLYADGELLGELPMANDWTTVAFEVPAGSQLHWQFNKSQRNAKSARVSLDNVKVSATDPDTASQANLESPNTSQSGGGALNPWLLLALAVTALAGDSRRRLSLARSETRA